MHPTYIEIVASIRHTTVMEAIATLTDEHGMYLTKDQSFPVDYEIEGCLPGTDIPFLDEVYQNGACMKVDAQRTFVFGEHARLHILETHGQLGPRVVVLAEMVYEEPVFFMSRIQVRNIRIHDAVAPTGHFAKR